MPSPDTPFTLFDFADPQAVAAWAPIDDRVMGGVSHSRLRHDAAGHAVFEGTVSLAHGGGFASVRCRPGAHGAPGAGACIVEVRGDGRRFKLGLLTDDRFDGLVYQAAFAPDGAHWQRIRLPLAAFRPTRRGREVPGAPPLEPARIRQVGLTIAERQSGPFALAVRCIGLT